MPARFFSQEEYTDRLESVQTLMVAGNIGVLVSTTPENIFYLTGHHTQGYYMFQAVAVWPDMDPVLIGRRGELVNARTNSWIEDYLPYDDIDDPIQVTARLIKGRNPSYARIGLEWDSWFLPVRSYHSLRSQLAGYDLVDSGSLIGRLRVVKSAAEVEYIRQAARFAEAGMHAALNTVKPGIADHAVAAAIFDAMMKAGCNYLAMEPFVAVGPRSGSMHSVWDNREICKGDTILLEIAGCCNRYHAALEQSLHVGNTIPEEVAEWSALCISAVKETIGSMAPGVTSGEVAQACRRVIEGEGSRDKYQVERKRVGYSIGIAFAPDWGEGHLMDLKDDDPRKLKPGMTFHVPLALRKAGAFGVGFSETVRVTSTGVETLTNFPMELVQIPA